MRIADKTQQTLEGLPHLPGLENGPGFDSQGSVNFFTKYCFPNLHRIQVKAFEVEDCEFVPVHHQPKVNVNSDEIVPKTPILCHYGFPSDRQQETKFQMTRAF